MPHSVPVSSPAQQSPQPSTMAKLAVLALVALIAAPLASAACTGSRQAQTGTLKSQSPAGCLAKNKDKLPLDGACFNELTMNITSLTGTGCDPSPANFDAGFTNSSCFEGTVSSGLINGTTVNGRFITDERFEGELSPGSMVVSIAGIPCKLTYAVKNVGKAVALKEAEAKETIANATAAYEEDITEVAVPADLQAKADEEEAKAKAAEAEASPAPSPAPEPSPAPKSAALVSVPSAVLAVLAGVAALAF